MSRRGFETLEYRNLPFALRAASADGGEFEGLASAFYTIDDSWWNDIVAPGAFLQDLPLFLSEGFVAGINHDWDCPIGRPIQAEETGDGLFVKASISDTQAGRDCRTLMKDGVLKRMSIGFRVFGRRFLETSEEVAAWWREVGYAPTPEDVAKSQFGARLLTRLRLYEFSPVAVPANRRAVITGVKEGGAEGETEGAPFARHSGAVLGQLEEWVKRLEDLRALRGGDLSPNHRLGLLRVRGLLLRALGPEGPEGAELPIGQDPSREVTGAPEEGEEKAAGAGSEAPVPAGVQGDEAGSPADRERARRLFAQYQSLCLELGRR
jgi:HK97 family phage prohead protease